MTISRHLVPPISIIARLNTILRANMLVYSEDVNARLQKIFLDDQKNSTRIRPAQWRKRSLAHKAFESILRLLSPIL